MLCMHLMFSTYKCFGKGGSWIPFTATNSSRSFSTVHGKIIRLSNQYQAYSLLYWIFRYLLETGSMKLAQSLAEDAEPLCDAATDRGKVQLSYLYNTYGVVQLQHQNIDSAETWFKQVYDIRRRHLGDLDINTVAVRLNFILVLLDKKRYEEAMTDLNALRELLPSMPELPVRMASGVFDFLSVACFRSGDFDDAWSHIQTSIKMTEQSVPPISQGSG